MLINASAARSAQGHDRSCCIVVTALRRTVCVLTSCFTDNRPHLTPFLRQLERAMTGVCPPAACAVGSRLCQTQRPIHIHWVATTHRHRTYDSANPPACTVARACAQRGRCRVRTCQCLLRANQRAKQAETQPRGMHCAYHAQAGHFSTIGCRLDLALAPARALQRTCTSAKDKVNRGAKWPVDGRCAVACQSVNFNR